MQTQWVSSPGTHIEKRLAQVYWVGGSPCSGKSSAANMLAAWYGLDVYHIDEAVGSRLGPYDAMAQPCMHRWTAGLASGQVTWDDLWMRPLNVLLEEVYACYNEQFELALADILTMDLAHPMLVEGNPLLPEWVLPLVSDTSHAAWLVATEPFQRRMYPRRGPWVQEILSQCSDPDGALRNWMDRDVVFAERVSMSAESLGVPLIRVDGQRSIEDTASDVAEVFRLAPESGKNIT